jgi:hypothetical protein
MASRHLRLTVAADGPQSVERSRTVRMKVEATATDPVKPAMRIPSTREALTGRQFVPVIEHKV